MRISDWSSDVCSSDLFTYIPVGFEGRSAVGNTALGSALLANAGQQNTEPGPGATEGLVFGDRFPLSIGNERQNLSLSTRGDITDWLRSEEHTSELQSIMRISYDVFCLKTNNNHNTH